MEKVQEWRNHSALTWYYEGKEWRSKKHRLRYALNIKPPRRGFFFKTMSSGYSTWRKTSRFLVSVWGTSFVTNMMNRSEISERTLYWTLHFFYFVYFYSIHPRQLLYGKKYPHSRSLDNHYKSLLTHTFWIDGKFSVHIWRFERAHTGVHERSINERVGVGTCKLTIQQKQRHDRKSNISSPHSVSVNSYSNTCSSSAMPVCVCIVVSTLSPFAGLISYSIYSGHRSAVVPLSRAS